jgi:hypothetical protein
MVSTVGAFKYTANNAVLQRICDVSAHLASARGSTEPPPAMSPDTFTDFDAATQKLPKVFVSSSAIPVGGYIWLYAASKNAKWDWAKHPEKFNWQDNLKNRR